MVDCEQLADPPIITVIGGGTGSFMLLSELKHATPNISAVVNMSDDGGSTGRLRDELGVLPPGDIRQCLVALSEIDETRDMFNYRFEHGSLQGHSLGNIILSGLELRYGDFDQAIKIAAKLLSITGRVIPITTENHTLTMQDGDDYIQGEYVIGHRPITNRSAKVTLDPQARISPQARQAIVDSDMVVVAPGNLYGSLLPALAVGGLRQAFEDSKARKVMVTNLVTKPGQTDGWHVVDYVNEVEKYCGHGTIDYVLYNIQMPSTELLEKYAADNEKPVNISQERFLTDTIKATPIGAELLAKDIYSCNPADTAVRRTLIRHDARKVTAKLLEIAGD